METFDGEFDGEFDEEFEEQYENFNYRAPNDKQYIKPDREGHYPLDTPLENIPRDERTLHYVRKQIAGISGEWQQRRGGESTANRKTPEAVAAPEGREGEGKEEKGRGEKGGVEGGGGHMIKGFRNNTRRRRRRKTKRRKTKMRKTKRRRRRRRRKTKREYNI